MSVIVTPTAIKEVGDIMKQQNLNPETTCLRVGVKGGGCSGFSYLLDLTENQKETDEVWTCRAMVVDGKRAQNRAAATSSKRHRECTKRLHVFIPMVPLSHRVGAEQEESQWHHCRKDWRRHHRRCRKMR